MTTRKPRNGAETSAAAKSPRIIVKGTVDLGRVLNHHDFPAAAETWMGRKVEHLLLEGFLEVTPNHGLSGS
jgi:hypothetical protein